MMKPNHKRNCVPGSVVWGVGLMLLMIVPLRATGSDAFRRDGEALVRGQHRLSGTDEGAAAASYMAERLAAIGVDQVVVQPFRVPQTEVRRCELLLEGVDHPLGLYPMRPNTLIPPVTPPGGVQGQLRVLGRGEIDDFKRSDVRGAIVVMDYNNRDGWLRAFRFGAQAVIFVRRGLCGSGNAHHVEIPVNLPRFFYDGDPADLVDGRNATIHSEVTWKPGVGRNVFGYIRGTDPVFGQGRGETIVLAAPLDSFGEVPRLSAGGRGAANLAALLQLAEGLVGQRPRRNVLVAAFDNQARLHDGARLFYRAIESETGVPEDARTEGRLKSLQAEEQFIADMRALLSHDQPLLQSSPVRRQLLGRLIDRAAEHTAIVAGDLFALREQANQLARNKPVSPADQARIDSIKADIAGVWLPRRDAWNQLRRALGRDKAEDYRALTPAVAEHLETVITDVRETIARRAAELDLERAALDADMELKALLGGDWLALHISLALGDTTPRWGIIIGGDSSARSPNDNPGLYGKVQGVFRHAYRSVVDEGGDAGHFALESVDQSHAQTRLLWGGPGLVHSGEIAGLSGIYNVVAGTMHERLALEGTPDDRLENLDLARIERQARELGAVLNSVANLEDEALMADMPARTATAAEEPDGVPADELRSVADQPGLSLRRGIVASREYVTTGFRSGIPAGPAVMGMLYGSSIPNTRMAGAVVQVFFRVPPSLSYRTTRIPAFDDYRLKWTNENGVYDLGPVYGFSLNHQTRGFAAIFDERGTPVLVSDTQSHVDVRYRLNVFRCASGYVVLPPQQRSRRSGADAVKIMSARADAVLDPKKSFSSMADGVLSWYTDERGKGVKLFGLDHVVGLNSGPATDHRREPGENGTGSGFPLQMDYARLQPTAQSASDIWRLNDVRLNVLRSKGILDSSLAELHGQAEDLLIQSESAPSALQRAALATSAFWMSRATYNRALGVLDDIVVAVLILLALCVPFAFAVERVVIGATTIYRQIGWFATIFVLAFLTLYFSHPAFAIADTPVIIFLGFAIVVMSVIVIGIIMQKFEVELKAMQGMMSTVHAINVSRLGTFMAAMQMGISTMRRRPLRTALTGTTIVLLTFTILSFASFSTQSGIVKLFAAPKPDYAGVWVHHVNWTALSDDVLEVLQGRWGERARIHPRYWISRQRVDDPGIVLARDTGEGTTVVSGLLGMDAEELAERADLQDVLGDRLEGRVLLSQGVARALGTDVGETIRVKGLALTVAAILDPVQVYSLADMDGREILPVDFSSQTSSASQGASADDMLDVARFWTRLGADDVVIVSTATARQLGASLYGVHLYTDDAVEAVAITEALARMLPYPVLGTRPEGVFRHVLGTVLEASGVQDLFFPILLGGLVIFGTMLGSVTDREREIYTFSALGLAPRHVATLFFAEAIVYSLIGGMGGYLLAQGIVKTLSVLAAQGWVQVPDMNMTSTNTIVTILIVMATVLAAAIYPAIKAARSANPGLLRVWKPPAPVGDLMDMVFPFTVSEYDITGVVSFLKEHFDNYSDTGLGQFMASGACLVREPGGMLGLDSELALSPFDLGVSETFSLRSSPSEIKGIDEVRIRCRRLSGQPGDWVRLNKVFLDDLRRQFLLWRSLPAASMEIYRDRTLASIRKEHNG